MLWIDAQFWPVLAHWIRETCGVVARTVLDLGLRDARDLAIFRAAQEAGAVVMSKDSGVVLLLEQGEPLVKVSEAG